MSNNLSEVEQAYAQAKQYGKELAQLYAAEKKRRYELELTTQKLQAIFDTAPSALAVVDDELTIVEANPRFLMLLELSKSCIGQALSQFLPIEEIQQVMQSQEMVNTNLGHVEVEINAPLLRTLLVTFAALKDRQGWVLILHDLTERKRLEGLKDEFVNIAAHELRTPLAGIIGFVGVLEEELNDVENPIIENLVELILQSNQRLKVIIDELVSFAATHRGATGSLHLVNINLNWLLTKTVKLLEDTIEAKDITCHFELPVKDMTIQGDQFILGDVMYQIIKNAVTFNKSKGQIFIRVQSIPMVDLPDLKPNFKTFSDEQEVTIIDIEDTGIGIPQTDLARIFDRFYQVEEHLTRGVGGLGLGLTIAQHGVERHGGQITVTSELGKGSTFRIVLPYITELTDVSIDNRVDVAYQQTIIYAKEIARAMASERKTNKKIDTINNLGSALDTKLHDLSNLDPDTPAHKEALATLKQITQQILDLSTMSKIS